MKEGRWELSSWGVFPDDHRIQCSECKYQIANLVTNGALIEKIKYCPNCGAKMEEKKTMRFEIHSVNDFEKAVKKIMEVSE